MGTSVLEFLVPLSKISKVKAEDKCEDEQTVVSFITDSAFSAKKGGKGQQQNRSFPKLYFIYTNTGHPHWVAPNHLLGRKERLSFLMPHYCRSALY